MLCGGWLLWIDGGRARAHRVRGRVCIGRAADCELVVDDEFVSAHHCELRQMDDGCFVFDLGSSNGVFVNGARVFGQALVDNDVIRVGRSRFRYRSLQ